MSDTAEPKHTNQSTAQIGQDESWEETSSFMEALRFFETIGDATRQAVSSRVGSVLSLLFLAIVIAGAFVYDPVRGYYVAKREQEQLMQHLATLEDHNRSLSHKLNALQSREGIEDEARQRGYVFLGDQPVDVQGLPEEVPIPASARVAEQPEDSIQTRILDTLFQFKG